MTGPHKHKHSVFRNILEQPYNASIRLKLYSSTKGSLDWIQRLCLQCKLPVHNGCVNCIAWSESGYSLLSGSDDQHLVVTDPFNYKVLTDYKTSHRANIFCAKFLPATGDSRIISCSGDGRILNTDLNRLAETHDNLFTCHTGTTYKIATIPNDPHSFLSCGEDYTVRSFDLRVQDKCKRLYCRKNVLISGERAVTALNVNPTAPYLLATGASDSTVRLYDRRMLTTSGEKGLSDSNSLQTVQSFTAPGLENRSYRITSLVFSPEGTEILVSYSSEQLYLFSVKDQTSRLLGLAGREQSSSESMTPSIAPPVRRLRLRGDWSDTGPNARPEKEATTSIEVAQARPTLHATLMQRMTDVLSRMLNDPATRAALSQEVEEADGPVAPQESHENAPTADQSYFAIDVESHGVNPSENPATDEANSMDLADQLYSEDTTSQSLDGRQDLITDDIPGDNLETMETEQSELNPLPSFESTYSTFTQNLVNLSDLPPSHTQLLHQPTNLDLDSSSLNLPSTSTSTSAELEKCIQNTSYMNTEQNPQSTDDIVDVMTIPTTSRSAASELRRSVPEEIRSLESQLSTLVHGFIERHGSEPMLNLVYSSKGASQARIMMQPSNTGETSISQVQQTVPTASSTDGESTSESDEDQSTQPCDVSVVERDHCYESMSRSEWDNAPQGSWPENSQSNTSDVSDDDDCSETKSQLAYKQKFVGHRNARTMIKEAVFWGTDYVLSGSDCGHVFGWERETGRLVMLLEADRHVVNCVQPHPTLPLLATSGIDYDVKLWSPSHHESAFNPEMADELMKRNAVMLEETKDTITVPAAFMIRMLACLSQLRRGQRARFQRRNVSESDQE